MKKLSAKALGRILTLVYFLSLVPVLWIGLYDFPSADDFSTTIQARNAFLEGGFPGALQGGIAYAVRIWNTWTGNFTSNFFTGLSPSVFGLQWYRATVFILIGALTISVWYFLHALLVRAGKMDRYVARCIIMTVLLIMVQCMPEGSARVEGYYWYSGGVNYTGMQSLMLLFLGFLISAVYAEHKGERRLCYVLSIVMAPFMGGINYMSALTCAILMVFLLIFAAFVRGGKEAALFSFGSLGRDRGRRVEIGREKSIRLLFVPALLMLCGFALSVMAPGNSVRQGGLTGMGPFKTIFVCFYYTLYYCVGQWTRWEVLVLLLIAGIFFWKGTDGTRFTYRSPVFVFILCYGLASASIAPCLYAEGHIEAGRIKALYFIQYILCLVLAEGYLIGWAKTSAGRKKEKAERVFSIPARRAVRGLILFLVFGSALCCYTDRDYYTASSAIESLADGEAQAYRQVNESRLSQLTDESNTDPVLENYTAKPALLYFSDAAEDPEDWVNRGMARYFGKNSVRRVADE